MCKKLIPLIFLLLFIYLLPAQRYGESDDFSYALKLYNEGFYDIASQQFALFINRYPTSDRTPDAEFYLGLSLLNTPDLEGARIRFQSMAVAYPEHSRAPEAWQKVGECYVAQGKILEAARAYETVKILYPRNSLAPVALYQAAAIYFQEQSYDKAELTVRDFLDRYPESTLYPNGRLLYAKLLLLQQNYDQASKEFDKVLLSGATPDIQAEAQLGMGGFYYQLGHLERAKESYQTILTQFSSTPSAFVALIELSGILARAGEGEAAIKLLNEQQGRYKNVNQKSHLSLQLAAIYFLQENYFAARKAVETINPVSLNDTLATLFFFYQGNIALGEHKYAQSVESFKSLIENANLATAAGDFLGIAQKQLGYAYLYQDQFELAWNTLRTYITKYPEDPSRGGIFEDLFQGALRLKRFTDAEKIYREVLIHTPHYPYRDLFLFEMGKRYFDSNDHPAAKQKFEELLQDYPCSVKADSALNYIDVLGKYYVTDQKSGVNKLASMMGRVLSRENTRNLQLELARVYMFHLNSIDEALQLAREIIETETDSALVGEAYHLMGEGSRRKAELKRFNHENDEIDLARSLEFLKLAMNYINKVEFADSLSFYFIMVSTQAASGEGVPVNKQIQFWEHFIVSYPNSSLKDRAKFILANLYYENKQVTPALQSLAELKESPHPSLAGDAYYLMGKIYYDQKTLPDAENILKEFLLKLPRHPLRANGFGLLAKLNENSGKPELAAQFWSRLREEFDYSPAAIVAKTRIPEVYISAGQYQLAINYIQPYLRETTPSDLILRKLQVIEEPEFYFYHGKAQYNLDNPGEARRSLLTYVYENPQGKNLDESRLLLGEISAQAGERDAALLHLQLIIDNENSPFFLQAAAKSADIYFEKNEYLKAQQLYNKLLARITVSEQKAGIAARELICMINQGNLKQYEARRSVFSNEYSKNPNLNNFLASFEFEIGKYHYQNKNYTSAIKNFETITGKYKKSDFADDAEYYLGLTYTTLNRVDKAMDILSRFAEKYPNSPLKSNIYVTLGGLYYRAEKRELAVGSFQKAVETAQDADTRKLALSNLILIYRDLGLWDGVLSQARIYTEEFPQSPDIVDKKIMIGNALINLNRYSEAVDYLTHLKFQADSEQEPEIQFYIGEAYFNAGQYENAIREFVKIPLLSKQTQLQWEASALYYSGQAYEKLGRKNDAMRMYQEIVDRPGILVELKKEAQKRIVQLKES